MSHLVIVLTDEEIGNQPVAAVFDEKLRHALSCKDPDIIVRLRPELGCSTEVLVWLEEWTERFQKVKKQIYIVPANVNQLECLEVSHPDQDLKYAATLAELEDWLDIQNVEPLPQPEANEEEAVFIIKDAPQEKGPLTEARAGDELDFEIIDKEEKKAVPDIRLLPGSIVQISGEYICVGCSTSRMWLKGDVAKNCENAECVHPEAGWKMTYELF
jgi:hypothetical protein